LRKSKFAVELTEKKAQKLAHNINGWFYNMKLTSGVMWKRVRRKFGCFEEYSPPNTASSIISSSEIT